MSGCQTYWKDSKVQLPLPSLYEIRQRVQTSLMSLRKDIKRNLNPTPYKVTPRTDRRPGPERAFVAFSE